MWGRVLAGGGRGQPRLRGPWALSLRCDSGRDGGRTNLGPPAPFKEELVLDADGGNWRYRWALLFVGELGPRVWIEWRVGRAGWTGVSCWL